MVCLVDFGGAFGPDNVHLIGQGQFIFNPLVTGDGDIYFRLFLLVTMSLNGQVDKDFANEPVDIVPHLLQHDRSNYGILGPVPLTRTAIYPKSYRLSATNIDNLL